MSEAEFKNAYDNIKNLKSEPSQTDQLNLYAWGKIAQGLKNDKPKPGMFDIKGKAKWNAWKEAEDAGTTKEEAQKKYVEKYNELVNTIGTK